MSAPFFSIERWRWERMVLGCVAVLFLLGEGTLARAQQAQQKAKAQEELDDDEEESP